MPKLEILLEIVVEHADSFVDISWQKAAHESVGAAEPARHIGREDGVHQLRKVLVVQQPDVLAHLAPTDEKHAQRIQWKISDVHHSHQGREAPRRGLLGGDQSPQGLVQLQVPHEQVGAALAARQTRHVQRTVGAPARAHRQVIVLH